MPDALARLQQRFADGLLDGVLDPVELFHGDGERSRRRFALYRGNLAANWQRALKNAYPVLQMLVGEDFFFGLARRFGRDVPFAEGDLNRFGSALPAFLESFEPARAHPYLADVARLEWALHRAHYGEDSPALGLEALASRDPEALEALVLRFRPTSALLVSDWQVARIWRAHQPGSAETLPQDPRGRCRVLVHRPRWRPLLRELSPGEHAALAALQAGEALGAALEAAIAAEAGFDPGSALPRWIEDGIFLPPADPRTGEPT